MLWLWLGHSLIAAAIVAPMFLTRRNRNCFSEWDVLVFVIPYFFLVLMDGVVGHKTLANLFFEGFAISITIPCAALARILIGEKSRIASLPCLLAFLLGVVAVVAIVTPPLPE